MNEDVGWREKFPEEEVKIESGLLNRTVGQ